MDIVKVRTAGSRTLSPLVVAKGSVSGAVVFDLSAGSIFSATIAGAATFSFTNPPPSGEAGTLIIVLTNPGAGVIAWPGSVDFGSEGAPELPESGLARLAFATIDGGDTWTGVLAFMRQD